VSEIPTGLAHRRAAVRHRVKDATLQKENMLRGVVKPLVAWDRCETLHAWQKARIVWGLVVCRSEREGS
jgi:hypothetical protein